MNYRHSSILSKLWETIIALFMVVLSITILYPFWHVVVLSFSTPDFADKIGIKLFPQPPTLNNFAVILSTSTILIAYQNTIIRTVAGTILSVMFTMGLSYGLAKKKLMLNKLISVLVLITLMFGGGLIPTFFLVRSLGIYDTIFALILPGMLNAYSVFIARNFIISLPESLEEAAFIDGANSIYIFFRIILPLSAPIIATLALWAAVGNWNSWFDSLVYTRNRNLVTLQLLLRQMMQNLDNMDTQPTAASISASIVNREAYKAATIIITILPIICVYPFLQKYFIKGIMVGAVKG